MLAILYMFFHKMLLNITGWLTYPSEKYESQMGWSFPIHEKIKFMFQTTNQINVK